VSCQIGRSLKPHFASACFSGATTRRPRSAAISGAVLKFAEHFHRSPDDLVPDHLRHYQRYLLQEKKLAPSTVEMRISELRFLPRSRQRLHSNRPIDLLRARSFYYVA